MRFEKGDMVKTQGGAVLEVVHCSESNSMGVCEVTLKGGEWNSRQPADTLTLVRRTDSIPALRAA